MTDSCKSSIPTSCEGSSTPSPLSSSRVKLLRTPRSGMRTSSKLKQAFKSPFRAKEFESSSALSTEEEIASLKEKIQSMDEEISSLEKEYNVSELQDHINKLHEYNDIKDAGQLILGKLAEIEGKTTKEMYKEFDLEIDD